MAKSAARGRGKSSCARIEAGSSQGGNVEQAENLSPLPRYSKKRKLSAFLASDWRPAEQMESGLLLPEAAPRRQLRIRVCRRRRVLGRKRAVRHALRREKLHLGFLVRYLLEIFRHHNQRLRPVPRVERALERLRLHTALLAGCFFERRLEHLWLAVQLIRHRCRKHRHEHRYRGLDFDADQLAVVIRGVPAVNLQKRCELVFFLRLLDPLRLWREAVADANPPIVLDVDIVWCDKVPRRRVALVT